jgi:hypothetical protein
LIFLATCRSQIRTLGRIGIGAGTHALFRIYSRYFFNGREREFLNAKEFVTSVFPINGSAVMPYVILWKLLNAAGSKSEASLLVLRKFYG